MAQIKCPHCNAQGLIRHEKVESVDVPAIAFFYPCGIHVINVWDDGVLYRKVSKMELELEKLVNISKEIDTSLRKLSGRR